MWLQLRTGAWITPERIKGYSILLIVGYVLGFTVLFLTLRDGLDWDNRPFGTDFAGLYAAGTMVADGTPAAPYDLEAFIARQQALFGAQTAVFSWNYPPFFLAVSRALASLHYLHALLLWQGVTLALSFQRSSSISAMARWASSSRPCLAPPCWRWSGGPFWRERSSGSS